jgi:uncharacterized protein
MEITEIARQMIDTSQGNLHDINHFLKVFAYAKIIAECEGLSVREQQTAEIAALVHDIACPLCREKYGNTNGNHQEAEGAVLAKDFLRGKQLPKDVLNRVVFLVGHHHTYTGVDGPDYQVLLEADFLVNADESQYSKEVIRSVKEKIFRTKTGTALLQSVYGVL